MGGSQARTVTAPGIVHAYQVGAQSTQPACGRVIFACIRVGYQAGQLYLQVTQGSEQHAFKQQPRQEDGGTARKATEPQGQTRQTGWLKQTVEPGGKNGAAQQADNAKQ